MPGGSSQGGNKLPGARPTARYTLHAVAPDHGHSVAPPVREGVHCQDGVRVGGFLLRQRVQVKRHSHANNAGALVKLLRGLESFTCDPCQAVRGLFLRRHNNVAQGSPDAGLYGLRRGPTVQAPNIKVNIPGGLALGVRSRVDGVGNTRVLFGPSPARIRVGRCRAKENSRCPVVGRQLFSGGGLCDPLIDKFFKRHAVLPRSGWSSCRSSRKLPKALLRPGRFDRRVIVERPDLKGRIETLKVHAKDVKMDETVDFEEIALATSGAVGSDLANMINEAALGAVKAGRKAVSQKDLFEAVEVVIAGKEKKDRILGDEEKHIVAYHEVGHALVMALQKESEPVQKITIVPRTMGALGYTMQRPEEEKYLNKKDEMLADLVSFFGGRAAEEVKFNSVTTGASNDIERATAIARAMVTQYGMSDEFGLIGLESITNRYLDGRAVMNCAETTAAKVDEVVMKMLKEAYAKAVTYIRENMDILDEAAEFLIQRETITGKEFMEIFNKYKNPVEESDKNVSETAENDAEISEAEVKTDSEIKTEEENTSTYNTGYAQWVEDDDDEE